ncbi:hypothetical protein Syun_004465 [Stephania yunnanensis]|uniref:Uncharacterized protein n=1 Tax=Stephania yunnanensis TaxID=152371 RepID=A0AAP0L4H0_9MAGN
MRPKLALCARIDDSADLASATKDQVSGQFGATTGGNLVEFTHPDSLLCVHDAIDCSSCDPTLGEWQPKLAFGARVTDSADLASTAMDHVLGQSNTSSGGNLVTRSAL